jgi:hypothetical protein
MSGLLVMFSFSCMLSHARLEQTLAMTVATVSDSMYSDDKVREVVKFGALHSCV